jgi:hypothetical protein
MNTPEDNMVPVYLCETVPLIGLYKPGPAGIVLKDMLAYCISKEDLRTNLADVLFVVRPDGILLGVEKHKNTNKQLKLYEQNLHYETFIEEVSRFIRFEEKDVDVLPFNEQVRLNLEEQIKLEEIEPLFIMAKREVCKPGNKPVIRLRYNYPGYT